MYIAHRIKDPIDLSVNFCTTQSFRKKNPIVNLLIYLFKASQKLMFIISSDIWF